MNPNAEFLMRLLGPAHFQNRLGWAFLANERGPIHDSILEEIVEV